MIPSEYQLQTREHASFGTRVNDGVGDTAYNLEDAATVRTMSDRHVTGFARLLRKEGSVELVV